MAEAVNAKHYQVHVVQDAITGFHEALTTEGCQLCEAADALLSKANKCYLKIFDIGKRTMDANILIPWDSKPNSGAATTDHLGESSTCTVASTLLKPSYLLKKLWPKVKPGKREKQTHS